MRYFSTKSTDNNLAVSCSGPRRCDLSLSRITAQRFALRYKRTGPFLLGVKFSIKKMLSIFPIFRDIFKKSLDFFKFKRSIRSFVFCSRHFRKLALTTEIHRTFFVEREILHRNARSKIMVSVTRLQEKEYLSVSVVFNDCYDLFHCRSKFELN